MLTAVLADRYTLTNYIDRLRANSDLEQSGSSADDRRKLGLATALISDGVTLLCGISRVVKGSITAPGAGAVAPEPGGGAGGGLPAPAAPDGRLKTKFFFDRVEQFAMLCNALLALATIGYQTYAFANNPEYSEMDNSDSGLREAARLLGARLILMSFPRFFGICFTQTSFGTSWTTTRN